MAACLSTGGVASHRTAACLHQVAGFRPGQPEITVPRGCAYVRNGVRLHESIDLALSDPMRIADIPVSSPARLAVDLGAVVPFPRYSAAIDDLLTRKLLTWDDALDALFAHSKQGRNGVGPLRALLAERYGEDIPESALELAFVRGFAGRGLPLPEGQVEIFDEEGFIARVDFAYPGLRIAIELDGRRYHLTGTAFEVDRAKRNRLKLAGWLVLEFTWQMLMDSPDTVYRQIRKALASGATPHPFSGSPPVSVGG